MSNFIDRPAASLSADSRPAARSADRSRSARPADVDRRRRSASDQRQLHFAAPAARSTSRIGAAAALDRPDRRRPSVRRRGHARAADQLVVVVRARRQRLQRRCRHPQLDARAAPRRRPSTRRPRASAPAGPYASERVANHDRDRRAVAQHPQRRARREPLLGEVGVGLHDHLRPGGRACGRRGPPARSRPSPATAPTSGSRISSVGLRSPW